MFSGSYEPEDVVLLLKPVRLEPTAIVDKERLIQSGERHYSEMISREALPSPAYLRVFHESLAREKEQFARDVLILARRLATVRSRDITLVSLARAGTPVGVLLGRTLRSLLGRQATHYSLSIIRDRGIDETALRWLLNAHAAESVVFVDGWTGKGVVADELWRAVTRFNADHDLQLDPGLYTLADLCGAAAFAASAEDYLIPSCVLGATVSGLVSRSILNDTVIGPRDFHGCLYYEEFASHDLSCWFVDHVFGEIEQQHNTREACAGGVSPEHRVRLRQTREVFLADMRRRFGVRNPHHVKPGLGEATRVLLRRLPECVLVRDRGVPEVAHLLILAQEKNVPVFIETALPYQAAAIIKEVER